MSLETEGQISFERLQNQSNQIERALSLTNDVINTKGLTIFPSESVDPSTPRLEVLKNIRDLGESRKQFVGMLTHDIIPQLTLLKEDVEIKLLQEGSEIFQSIDEMVQEGYYSDEELQAINELRTTSAPVQLETKDTIVEEAEIEKVLKTVEEKPLEQEPVLPEKLSSELEEAETEVKEPNLELLAHYPTPSEITKDNTKNRILYQLFLKALVNDSSVTVDNTYAVLYEKELGEGLDVKTARKRTSVFISIFRDYLHGKNVPTSSGGEWGKTEYRLVPPLQKKAQPIEEAVLQEETANTPPDTSRQTISPEKPTSITASVPLPTEVTIYEQRSTYIKNGKADKLPQGRHGKRILGIIRALSSGQEVNPENYLGENARNPKEVHLFRHNMEQVKQILGHGSSPENKVIWTGTGYRFDGVIKFVTRR